MALVSSYQTSVCVQCVQCALALFKTCVLTYWLIPDLKITGKGIYSGLKSCCNSKSDTSMDFKNYLQNAIVESVFNQTLEWWKKKNHIGSSWGIFIAQWYIIHINMMILGNYHPWFSFRNWLQIKIFKQYLHIAGVIMAPFLQSHILACRQNWLLISNMVSQEIVKIQFKLYSWGKYNNTVEHHNLAYHSME